MKPRSGAGILVFIAIAAGAYLTKSAALGRPAPAFSLPEVYGGRVSLDDYRGRPVLLAFWMTSCGICRRELPVLSALAPEFRAQGIDVVSIHLGGKEEARDYLRANHLSMTALYDPDGTVAQTYRVGGVPKLVLVAADGTIKRSSSGLAGEDLLRDWIDAVAPRP